MFNNKKLSDLLPEISQKTGISEKDIKALTKFYFSDVGKRLASLNENRVGIAAFGSFKVRLRGCIHYLEKHRVLSELEEPLSFKKQKEKIAMEDISGKLKEFIEQHRRDRVTRNAYHEYLKSKENGTLEE